MPFGIFSMPNTSAQSTSPDSMARAAIDSAAAPDAQPASTSMIGMPVRAETAEHAVAGGDTRVRGAAERGAERGIARVAQCGAHGFDAEVDHRAIVEPSEVRHAHAADLDPHARAPTPVPRTPTW